MEKTADEIWLEEHSPAPALDEIIADAIERTGELDEQVEHGLLEGVKEM